MTEQELKRYIKIFASQWGVSENCIKVIPKSELEEGVVYQGECRNSNDARWNGKVFQYTRTKFGSTFTESINHFEDDNGYDVFVPMKIIKLND